MNFDILCISLENCNSKFLRCSSTDNSYFLLATFVFIVSFDLCISRCYFFISTIAHCNMDFHTRKIKFFSQIIVCLVITGDINFFFVYFNFICSGQFCCVCSKRIIRTVMLRFPAASCYCRAFACILLCVEVNFTDCCFMSFTVCIYIFDSTDASVCSTVFGIIVIRNIIKLIQTVIESNDSTNILCSFSCCLNFASERIAFHFVCIPCLCNIKVTSKDTTDFICTCNTASCLTRINTDLDSIRCRRAFVSSTNNTTNKLVASFYVSIESTACYTAAAHSIVTRSKNTTNILFTINSCITYTIFDCAMHTSCNRTNHILIFVITNYNVFFNCTIFDCCCECSRASCKWVTGNFCSNKTGFQST